MSFIQICSTPRLNRKESAISYMQILEKQNLLYEPPLTEYIIPSLHSSIPTFIHLQSIPIFVLNVASDCSILIRDNMNNQNCVLQTFNNIQYNSIMSIGGTAETPTILKIRSPGLKR